MKDDESDHNFHMNLLELANASRALGETMTEEKLVRKILRSLPKRFDMKVTAIEESHDIANMKVEEIIGLLQTFEMAINDQPDKKNNGIAFLSNTCDKQTEGDLEIDNEISEAVALLGRQINKVLKRLGRGLKSNAKNIPSDIRQSNDSKEKTKAEEHHNLGKGPQCFRCEGYGHYKSECPTNLKKHQKGYHISWSDEEEEKHSGESANHVAALTGRCKSDGDSYENDTAYDELFDSYKEVYIEREKMKRTVIKLEDEIGSLTSTVSDLKNEVRYLTHRLNNVNKPIKCQTMVMT
jgi:hypothetical protein